MSEFLSKSKWFVMAILILLSLEVFHRQVWTFYYEHWQRPSLLSTESAATFEGSKHQYTPIIAEYAPASYDLLLVFKSGDSVREVYYLPGGLTKTEVISVNGKWVSTPTSYVSRHFFMVFPFGGFLIGAITVLILVVHLASRKNKQAPSLFDIRYELLAIICGLLLFLGGIILPMLGLV